MAKLIKTKKVKKVKKVKKAIQPGDMFNAFKAKKTKGMAKLRTSSAVVKSEQNASHKFAKK